MTYYVEHDSRNDLDNTIRSFIRFATTMNLIPFRDRGLQPLCHDDDDDVHSLGLDTDELSLEHESQGFVTLSSCRREEGNANQVNHLLSLFSRSLPP